MLCSNCHREVHAGLRPVPEGVEFDETYATFSRPISTRPCPQCGADMPTTNRYCSRSCSGKSRQRIDWSRYDLAEMIKTMNNCQIADLLGVSDVAVLKHLRKVGIVR